MAARDPEIEVIARELAGRCLDDVRYYSLPCGMTDKPTWDRDVAHVADYGIDLVAAEGATGITWAAYGNFGYGLHLSRSPLLTRLTRAEFCSAAGEQPWDAALGQPITEAEVRWLDVTWGEQETAGPVALILRFAAGTSIVIACGSWSGPQEPLFPTGDDIVVLWQPGTLPVLAPFLQDGPPGSCPFPEQTAAQRSEPASGTRHGGPGHAARWPGDRW